MQSKWARPSVDLGEALLRSEQHQSPCRDTHEGDEGNDCPIFHCGLSVWPPVVLRSTLPAELKSFCPVLIEDIFQAVSHAGLVLMLHGDSGIVEKYHAYHMLAVCPLETCLLRRTLVQRKPQSRP